jgi:type II secretory pathway pseudopilin PulG
MNRAAIHLRHARRGFTLMELLVVGMLGTMVLAMIANVWRWYGHSVAQQQTVTMLAQELKLASEAIAQDYGYALASRTTDGAQLEMDIDGPAQEGTADWGAPDTVILYAVVSGQLVRTDSLTGAEVPIAGHMDAMEMSTVSGHLEVKLTAKFRHDEQAITLRLTGT